MSNLVNWTMCRLTALELAKTRAHKFTRVSMDVMEHLEGLVISELAKIVAGHPSIGKTIQMGTHTRKGKNNE